jgi:metal-responsive CopG/Arc/MetJ family transcriptional regulator
MTTKKFAISIPEDVMERVDRAAAQRGETRSRFISNVLRRVADAQRDAEIRRRVDEVFADPAVSEEQRSTAEAYGSVRSARGTKW